MKNSSSSWEPEAPGLAAGSVLCRPAEESFRKGLDAWRRGERTVAMALFEAAIEIERRSGSPTIQPRYLSYFGLALVETGDRAIEGLALCRDAVEEEFFNPDLFFNLAKAHALAGAKRESFDAALRGIALDPRHPALTAHLRRMGIRRRPPLPFLARANPLNVALGKIFRRGAART